MDGGCLQAMLSAFTSSSMPLTEQHAHFNQGDAVSDNQ